MKQIKLQITKFKTKKIKIKCPIHGIINVKPAFDPILKKMTAISCEVCPTILK